MQQQLLAAGYKASAVDLGLSQSGDLADFCRLHEYAALDAIFKCQPLQARAELNQLVDYQWYIIHASKLKDLPRVGWIIEGIIPERGLTVLYGPSGSGKSFLAVDYALTVAQRDAVAYMVYEGDAGYYQRIAAWKKHSRLSEGHLYMVMGGGVPLMEAAQVETFISESRNLKPKLVIVDTVARSMVGSDENSTRDMGILIVNCQRIMRELGAAVLLVHHTNKGGVYERGSGALRGASDSMIKMHMDDDVLIVECAKTKDAEPFPTQYLKMLPVEVELDGQLMSVPVLTAADNIIQTEDSKLTNHQARVLEALSLGAFINGASLGDLVDTLETIGKGQVIKVLSRLSKLNLVEQTEIRGPWLITEKGQQVYSKVALGTQGLHSPHSPHTTDKTSQDGFVKTVESLGTLGTLGTSTGENDFFGTQQDSLVPNKKRKTHSSEGA